jgi:hypothetical protein
MLGLGGYARGHERRLKMPITTPHIDFATSSDQYIICCITSPHTGPRVNAPPSTSKQCTSAQTQCTSHCAT